MTVAASVVDYALAIARAGVAAALAFSMGTVPDAANRVGTYADLTASAEKFGFVVGGVSGPTLNRESSQVIAVGLVVDDASFTIADNGNRTRTITFQAGSITAGFGLVIDAGAQAANRILSVPVLGGNRTLALIDQAQTFSPIQTFTLAPVMSALTPSRLVRTNGSNALESNAALTATWVLFADANGWPSTDTGFRYSSGTVLSLGTTSNVLFAAGSNARAQDAYITLNSASGYTRGLLYQTGGASRWLFGGSTTAESGSNAGTSFYIVAYDDAGSSIDIPLTITRAANGTIALIRPTSVIRVTATTSAADTILTLGNNSSGTPAAGYGTTAFFNLKSSTTNDQNAAKIDTTWVTATHASRAARQVFSVYDTAAREGLRIEASGSAPMIGFLGAAAVARATMAAATGTATRTTFDTATVTTAQLAERVKAMIDDSRSYGLHG